MKKNLLIILIILTIITLGFIGTAFLTKLPPESKRNILCYPAEHTNQIYTPFPENSFDKVVGTRYYFEYNGFVYYHEPLNINMNGEAYGPHDTKKQNSDPKTFQCIDANFAKDKNQVYYWGSVVKKADPETFRPLDWPKAKDKNYYFRGTEITGKVD
jgi:hypothetical protein